MFISMLFYNILFNKIFIFSKHRLTLTKICRIKKYDHPVNFCFLLEKRDNIAISDGDAEWVSPACRPVVRHLGF